LEALASYGYYFRWAISVCRSWPQIGYRYGLDDGTKVYAPYPCPAAAIGTNSSAIGIGCGMKCCSAM
jgi:hypothetical protein